VTNFTNPFITTGVVSTGESAMMGMEAYNNTLEEGSAIVDQMFDDYVNEKTAERLKGVKFDESGTIKFVD